MLKMTAAIVITYLAGSIAIPLAWDRKHPQGRPSQRTPSTTGSMRVRGAGR